MLPPSSSLHQTRICSPSRKGLKIDIRVRSPSAYGSHRRKGFEGPSSTEDEFMYDRHHPLRMGLFCFTLDLVELVVALVGMGRLLKAVAECKEVARLDSNYCRAHNRLASLYVRLGKVEKEIHHYELSQNKASPSDVSQAAVLWSHFGKISEARKLRDWQTILAESRSAVSLGANLSPKVIFMSYTILKDHDFSSLSHKVFYVLFGTIIVALSLSTSAPLGWHVYLLTHNMSTIEYREAVRAMWLARKSGQKYQHPCDLCAYNNLIVVLLVAVIPISIYRLDYSFGIMFRRTNFW